MSEYSGHTVSGRLATYSFKIFFDANENLITPWFQNLKTLQMQWMVVTNRKVSTKMLKMNGNWFLSIWAVERMYEDFQFNYEGIFPCIVENKKPIWKLSKAKTILDSKLFQVTSKLLLPTWEVWISSKNNI